MQFPLKQDSARPKSVPAPDSHDPRMRYIWHLIENSYKPWGLSAQEADDLLVWYSTRESIDLKSLLKS